MKPADFSPTQLDYALAQYLGRELTPEAAAHIRSMALAQPECAVDPQRFEPQWYGDYSIAAESLRAILGEIHSLHERHWLETEKHRHGLPLAPDYEAMAADERAGNLVQFTARHASGELVGNLRMYLGTSRHTGTRFAREDTLFITPEHRGGMLAVRMLRYGERALRSLGVREIRGDSKLINGADVLMRRLGYQPVATQFVKVFDAEPTSQESKHVQ